MAASAEAHEWRHAGHGAEPRPPEEKIDADDFDEALGFIKASTTKMDRLINAVLTISREGNRTLRPEAVDMSALLATMSQAMAHQAQASAGATVDIGASARDRFRPPGP